MSGSRFEPAFHRIVSELRPYLDDVVIIGGWVPYLYKRYGGLSSWQANTSLTAEVDVLVDRRMPKGERVTIPDLLRSADFHPTSGEGGLAVWERRLEAGEKIEFLVENSGMRAGEGAVVAVTEQAGMGAISLTGLELMRWFRRRLPIPVPDNEGDRRSLDIWVPLLGAYAVNKASTFSRRREHPGGGNPKPAKDLLYLRDVMAAGSAAVRMIEDDLAEMTGDAARGRAAQARVRDAANTLGLALRGALRRILPEVAIMLAEREPVFTHTAALADVEGHLRDLVEILEDCVHGRS